MDDKAVTIAAAEPGQITALATIHHTALPDDFLPSLGADFLEQVYYPAAFRSRSAATLVASAAGAVVGFVTIAHDSAGFSRDVVGGQWPRLAFYAARAALRRPAHILSSLQVAQAALLSRPDQVPGEIVFIAVDASQRNRGVGKQLVAAALEYLREKEIAQCRTKTLAENHGVIAMYQGIGWHVRDRFRLIGRDYATLVSPALVTRSADRT